MIAVVIVSLVAGIGLTCGLIRWLLSDYWIRCPWCGHRICLNREKN